MSPFPALHGTELITQFGLMNKISTGHAFLDIALCMLMPALIKFIWPSLLQWLDSLEFLRTDVYSRSIEFIRKTEGVSIWSKHEDENPPNLILMNAIMAYINSIPGLQETCQRTSIQILLGQETQQDHLGQKSKKKDKSRYDSLEGVSAEPDFSNVYRYEVNCLPQFNHWIRIDPYIKFTRTERVMDDKAQKIKITFIFESRGKDGGKRIDAFLAKALDYYKDLRTKKEDQSRFMYIPCSFPGRHPESANSGTSDNKGPSGPKTVTYKRYKLSGRKTFNALYHPHKQEILRLVNDFMDKRGKFALPGYPDKLGFLLHGPPGTGKTSFIKALAEYTGRNVISIPLARISTNQELMDLMFDQRVALEGDDMPLSLPFSKSIFVIEDVDAAGKVVKRRKPGVDVAGQSEDSDSSTSTATEIVQAPDGTKQLVKVGKPPAWEDRLNLAGLLNVLDGVVDTPDRILVMTTNHAEKLDPALTRPGRVTQQIYMGHMGLNEAVQMLQDFYAGVEDEEVRQKLEGVFEEGRWTPAEVEALCAMHDTVDEVVSDLQRRREADLGGEGGGKGGDGVEVVDATHTQADVCEV